MQRGLILILAFKKNHVNGFVSVILDSGTKMASLLLSEGVLADKKDSLGITALMYACLSEHGLPYARLLLEQGNSDPYHKNNNGNNALDLARGRGDLVSLLGR